MKKLIIDTNLLVLFVVGSIDNGRQIKNSKKLREYSIKDFELLLEIMADFDEFYFTPYIAAETSNLLHRDLTGWVKDQIFEFLRILLTKTFKLIDANPEKDTKDYTFPIFGLTDNTFTHLVQDFMILTNDQDISITLMSIKPENVIYYKIIKELSKKF